MDQTISKQFHAALAYFLKKEGRGAQARLAQEQNIDRGYMNAIAKGRKAGAEELRTRIADHFQTTYEEMLAIGRIILEGGKVPIPGESGGAKQDIVESAEFEKSEKPRSSISDKLLKIVTILESDSRYGDALSGLVDAFHEAVTVKKDNIALQDRMKKMEARIAELERLASEKGPTCHCA